MRWLGLRAKRALDILLSALLLTLFSPLIAAAALAVRLTMGAPVVFRQPRLGYKGREFTILKFRTMTDEVGATGDPLPDDKRLTRFGALLRKTTIDELPELLNVLRGDMSIVGPRPLLVEYRDTYTPEQWRRHDMPPGMAGPVLAGGRNALEWDEKFRLDIAYVDQWSLWLDLKIFARTALAVVRREGVSAEGHVSMPRFENQEGGAGRQDDPKG